MHYAIFVDPFINKYFVCPVTE